MSEKYQVIINGELENDFPCRDDAHTHIKGKYRDIIYYLNYEPLGDGVLEKWNSNFLTIEIKKISAGRINLENLIKENLKTDKRPVVKEINVAKNLPCTPTRTRLITKNKKLEKAEEGKMKTDENGVQWISKRNKNGDFKWTKYYENNYTQTKRKGPKSPAKDFKEGTVKKGLDGKMWKVARLTNGQKRWARK